ncbi:hypothetical protein MC885_010212, partial [Smutsia gigantea]
GCAVERASEPGRRAGRSSRRRGEASACRPGSWEVGGPCSQPARGAPIGRLPAALRPEGGEAPRGCSRAEREIPAAPTPGWTPGTRVPHSLFCALPLPPAASPAPAPTVGSRLRSGGTPGLEADV